MSGNDLLSYVKVGHLVHVTGVVRINSSNSSSDIAITNMPFATVNASDKPMVMLSVQYQYMI